MARLASHKMAESTPAPCANCGAKGMAIGIVYVACLNVVSFAALGYAIAKM
jgi:hypothetical protein